MEGSILENLNWPQPAEHPANSCWQEDSTWCVLCGDSLPSFLSFGSVPYASNFHGYPPDDVPVSFLPQLLDVVIRLTEQKSWPGLAQDLTGHCSQPSPQAPTQISVAVDAYSSLSLTSSPENQLHPQLQGGLPFLQVTHSRHPQRPFLPEGTQRHWTCCKKRQKSFGNCWNIGLKCKKLQSGICLPWEAGSNTCSSHLPSDRLSHAVQLLLSLCWLQSPAYLA